MLDLTGADAQARGDVGSLINFGVVHIATLLTTKING